MSSQPFKLGKSNQFHPSKKMGQNFLVDENIASNIIESINLKNHDCILEIGPGTGVLTKYLVKLNLPYIGIELDKRLYHHLLTQYKSDKVEFINDDVLNIDLDKVLSKYKNPIMVANLPYSISSPMILKYLNTNKINIFYCLLQKELALRLLAKHNTKEYGSFSILTQYQTKITKILDVPPSAFDPIPKVNSIFVKFQKNKNQFNVNFAKFLRYCFQAKRKTLVNNLKHFYGLEKINLVFKKLKINNLLIRAEQINVPTFYKMFVEFNHE